MNHRWGTALVLASGACASFGSSGDEPERDAGTAPGVDGGDAAVGDTAAPSEDGALPFTCPTDALVCHGFEGTLTPPQWTHEGASMTRNFLSIATEGGRSFARAHVDGAESTYVEDRVAASLGAAQKWMEIELDVRVSVIDDNQKLEIATFAFDVSTDVYEYVQLLLGGRTIKVADFGGGGSYNESAGKVLPDGWNHLKLRVDRGGAAATVTVAGANLTHPLSYVTDAGLPIAKIRVGLVYAKIVNGPFTVDIDSIIVRGGS